VQRTLYLWLEGFSVDDGPLYRYDDPANHRTLAMIENGHAPIHILNVEPNQEVDLTLSSRKGEKYVKPKPRYKAFGGEGRRLGSPAAATDPVPSAPLETRALRALTALTTGVGLHDPEVELDDSQPVVSILFRLGDGTRLPARFNPSHTVQHLYEFVNAARALDVRNYVLMTTFPSTELTNRSLTLGEVPELKKGGAVVQKWT
jgi:UBX domain-containing protein 1